MGNLINGDPSIRQAHTQGWRSPWNSAHNLAFSLCSQLSAPHSMTQPGCLFQIFWGIPTPPGGHSSLKQQHANSHFSAKMPRAYLVSWPLQLLLQATLLQKLEPVAGRHSVPAPTRAPGPLRWSLRLGLHFISGCCKVPHKCIVEKHPQQGVAHSCSLRYHVVVKLIHRRQET